MNPLRAQLAAAFLAAPPTPPPGKGAEWGKAAPIGLLIIVLLGVALYLLIKSMNRHMRNVTGRTSFDTAVGGTTTADATAVAHVGSGVADTGRVDRAPVDSTTVETPGPQTSGLPSAPPDGR